MLIFTQKTSDFALILLGVGDTMGFGIDPIQSKCKAIITNDDANMILVMLIEYFGILPSVNYDKTEEKNRKIKMFCINSLQQNTNM